MVGPKQGALALVLLAASLAGCLGFDPAGDCTAQHVYADRLVFDQDGLYDAMEEAFASARQGPGSTAATHEEGAWTGTRGEVETVREDGRVFAHYEAAPDGPTSNRVHDSALDGYGTLWLDHVAWEPAEAAHITYEAPEASSGDHTLSMTFREANLTKQEGADAVRHLHAALFPHDGWDPEEDPTFAEAWVDRYEVHPPGPVDANGLVADLVQDGDLLAREAPFPDPVVPHTLGAMHLAGEDAAGYEGPIQLTLSHDVHILATGVEKPLVLEATPEDRAVVSNLGSAPLGAEDLRTAAEKRFGGIDGLPTLALEDARHEEGGEASAQTEGGCTPTHALGDELAARG